MAVRSVEKPFFRLDTFYICLLLVRREALLADVVELVGDLPGKFAWEGLASSFA